MKAMDYADFREAARRRLPRFLFEYIDGAALSEGTKQRNFDALDGVRLRQRVLRKVDDIDVVARWFGDTAALPVALGPIGIAGMNARRGEVQAARAARRAGIPFCLSTVSVCAIEEVAEALGGPFWFQLYIMRDRGLMRDLLARAAASGCAALIMTVDMPLPGRRYRDYRSGLAGASSAFGALRRFAQAAVHPRWAWDVGVRGRPHNLGNMAGLLGGSSGLEDFLAWMNGNFDPTVTWRDLEEVRAIWHGPLIVKGIMDAEDAAIVRDLGADGLVISNHGGRQLDGAQAPAEVIPAIAEALQGKVTLFADGGVRSGLDVVRLLALGADGVWLGRLWAYALAGGGEGGVARMIDNLAAEIAVTMALCGVTAASRIDRSILAP